MIRRQAEMEEETRSNMRGGTGDVTIRHFFKQDEFGAKVRLCANLVLPPGSSIGEHVHENEDEVYIVTRGSGILRENGEQKRISAGDAALTGKGGAHSIENDAPEILEITAFIPTY